MHPQSKFRTMSSGRFAEVRTPLILSILMVLMTQVGYLDLMNTWSGDEETLDETTDVLETGGSGSSNTLTPSVEGADLMVDVPMTNITFQYNPSAASGSGSGSSNSFTFANNKVVAGGLHTCAILDNGDLKCWGQDNYGQLGDGGSTNTNLDAPS